MDARVSVWGAAWAPRRSTARLIELHRHAGVAKLADAPGLGPGPERGGGSSPLARTEAALPAAGPGSGGHCLGRGPARRETTGRSPCRLGVGVHHHAAVVEMVARPGCRVLSGSAMIRTAEKPAARHIAASPVGVGAHQLLGSTLGSGPRGTSTDAHPSTPG